jgi:hypothetical protein
VKPVAAAQNVAQADMSQLLKRAAQEAHQNTRGIESAWANQINQAQPIFGTGVSYAAAPMGAQTYSANTLVGSH